MLTITECKKLLNRRGVFYTDEEIEKIRKVLYQLAEVKYQQIKNNKNIQK